MGEPFDDFMYGISVFDGLSGGNELSAACHSEGKERTYVEEGADWDSGFDRYLCLAVCTLFFQCIDNLWDEGHDVAGLFHDASAMVPCRNIHIRVSGAHVVFPFRVSFWKNDPDVSDRSKGKEQCLYHCDMRRFVRCTIVIVLFKVIYYL